MEHHADGLHRERRDAIDGKIEHLRERILRFACEAFGAVVIDLGRRVAHEWNEAADEEVALAVFQQMLHGTAAHQAEVGMVINGFGTHRAHHAVEGQRGGALEPGVGLALAAHAIDDVCALAPLVHHFGYGLHIVLEVGVDGHHHVGPVLGHGQPRP